MKRVLTIFLVCFIATTIFPQEYNTRKYTTMDGLYQQEIYSTFVTHDTILYLGEIRGISSFDGYSLEMIDAVENLEQAVLKNYYPLKNGCLIVSQKAFLYRNEDFNLLDLDTIVDYDRSSFYATEDGIFTFSTDNTIYKFSEEKGVFQVFKKLPSTLLNSVGVNYRFAESYYSPNIIRINNSLFFLDKSGMQQEIDDSFIEKECSQISDYLKVHNISIEYLNKLFENIYFPRIINPINKLITVTVYSENEKIAIIADLNKKEIINHYYLSDTHFLNVFPLNKNQILLSTHQGLIKVDNEKYYISEQVENMVTNIHTIAEGEDEKIYFGGYGSGISYWKNNTLNQIKGFDFLNNVLPGSMKLDDGRILFFQDSEFGGPYFIDNEKVLPAIATGIEDPTPRGFYSDTTTQGQLLLGLFHKGLGIVDSIKGNKIHLKSISKEKGIPFKRIHTFSEDKAGRIWCGEREGGLSIYDPNQDTAYTYNYELNNNLSFGVISSEKDHHDNIWLGTTTGLKFLNAPHRIEFGKSNIFNLAQSITLPNGDFSYVSLMKQVDEFLVFGNSSGIHFLDLNYFYENPNKEPLIYQLIYEEDIPGNGSEQNAILFDSYRKLWVGGQEGVHLFDWDKLLFDTTKNKIDIQYFVAGSQKSDFTKRTKISLPKDNRNFSIKFGPEKNISLSKNIFFDYYVLNSEQDTVFSELFDQVGYYQRDYLEPGNYTLIIKAKKHGQVMDQLSIKINVPKTLFENAWFWILIGLAGLVVIYQYSVIKTRHRRKIMEKELDVQKLLNEKEKLRVQTIINSFNPHFINNSLHWVQSRYNEDQSLVKLIGRLSENIAIIFSNTKEGKAYHSIDEELNVIQNYIEIQKIRFRNSFQFILENQIGDIKDVTNIILLHLQIHIENAVEHGIRNRETSTYVKLNLSKSSTHYQFTIEDDGCGRIHSKQIKSRGTQTGVKMIKTLMEIYNSRNPSPITQVYEDEIFEDSMGKKHGTRVIIQYPQNYKYEF